MAINDYHPPISKLFTYGECDYSSSESWANYIQELDLTDEHIPELIQMATDRELDFETSNETDCWAPVHAWRALGLLEAEAAIMPLLNLLEDPVHECAQEEIPKVISLIGPSALAAVQDYIANPSHNIFGRIFASNYFKRLYDRHPDQREQCIKILAHLLTSYKKNDPGLNGFLILSLCDLQAVDKASEIKKVFDAQQVDLMIMGDWDEVQVKLGLKTRKEVPLRRFSSSEVLGIFPPEVLEILTPFEQSPQRPSPQGFGHTPSKGKKKKKR
ncbi:DUF1186 domain-containing protein [Acaryochloris marina NIES-2412]|uniref:DUF1186 domain-containing protein n=1 Tax=Acaryochloris marina TaxID=155978 RepID=UPI004059602B